MGVLNLRSFNEAVSRRTKDLPAQQIVLFQKRIVFELYLRAAAKTPRKTGRAAMGWDITIDDPPTEEVQVEASAGVAEASLANLSPYKIVYLANLVFYIVFLEEGTSDQAPEGMLAISVAEVQAFIQ